MNPEQGEIYIGIDLNDKWTQVSFFQPGMGEPKTISMIAGEERYRIVTALYKNTAAGHWFVREVTKAPEPIPVKQQEECICVDKLLLRSLNGEKMILDSEEYSAKELLLLFLRKVIRLIPINLEFSQITGMAFNLEEIDFQRVRLLRQIMEELGVPRERVLIQDPKESFCHFAMNEEPELCHHDVVLFSCEKDQVKCQILNRNRKTVPHRIGIEERILGILPEAENDIHSRERDKTFGLLAQSVFDGRIVSAVYLVGDGFEGAWLKEALHILCRGRRAFQGRNLYSKGACCGAWMAFHKDRWEYVYLNDYKLKKNIYLQVRHGDQKRFAGLVDAGISRYEASGSLEVLLDGEPFVDIWLQEADSENARIESLELTGLPERQERTTRLKIEVLPAMDERLLVRISDLGFGPWIISSGKVWEYYIDE